jgi:hypothetical protein
MELLKNEKSLGPVSDYTYHASSQNSKNAGGYREGNVNTPDTVNFKIDKQVAPGQKYALKDSDKTIEILVNSARSLGKGLFWVTGAVQVIPKK